MGVRPYNDQKNKGQGLGRRWTYLYRLQPKEDPQPDREKRTYIHPSAFNRNFESPSKCFRPFSSQMQSQNFRTTIGQKPYFRLYLNNPAGFLDRLPLAAS